MKLFSFFLDSMVEIVFFRDKKQLKDTRKSILGIIVDFRSEIKLFPTTDKLTELEFSSLIF